MVEVIIFFNQEAADIERLNIPKKLQELHARIAITHRELTSLQQLIRRSQAHGDLKSYHFSRRFKSETQKNLGRQPHSKVTQDESRTGSLEMGFLGEEHMAHQSKPGWYKGATDQVIFIDYLPWFKISLNLKIFNFVPEYFRKLVTIS